MPAATRYPSFTRPALAPGLLGAVCLLVAIALVDTGWFFVFRFAICILAAIVAVFAFQAKAWWWLIGLVPIIVLWNPILPIDIDPFAWSIVHLAAAVVFVFADILIKMPVKDDKQAARGKR